MDSELALPVPARDAGPAAALTLAQLMERAGALQAAGQVADADLLIGAVLIPAATAPTVVPMRVVRSVVRRLLVGRVRRRSAVLQPKP